MFGCLFFSFASKPIGDKTCNQRTRRGHQGIVKPQFFLLRGQNNRCHDHGARDGNEGVVQESKRN